MEKISLIIPVYNVEKYLSQCLDSVISQSYKELEIIIIDDCGNDDSIKIAHKYAKKDERIKVILHKKNLGLAASRNTGLKNAKGDFIFFLDSDDYLDKDAIKNSYLAMKSTNSDIVITRTIPFKEDECEFLNRRLKDMKDWFNFKIIGDFEVNQDNFQFAISNFPTVSWGKLFRASFLRKNDLFFVNKNIIHEDEGFFLKFMSKFPKIFSIEKNGVYYRLRKKSLSFKSYNSEDNKRISNLKISLNDAISYIKKNSKRNFKKIILKSIYETYEKYEVFNGSCGFLYKKMWFKDNKKIEFFGITFFKQNIKNHIKTTKLLGIPIIKEGVR